jgi:RNA polymerase sigma factor (sigma-70 family)
MEEEIGDIRREHVVINLSAEQTEVLALLYTDREIDRKLGSIAFRFGQDKDDLRQELALKLSCEGYALRNVKCLKSWCKVTATNICNNEYRHDKVVKRHREQCLNENVQGKMRGGAIVLQRSTVQTPEQQMLEHELRRRQRSIINSLPQDVQTIAALWDEGKSAAEIAKEVGKSVATVYRKHKEFQMLLVGACVLATTE